MELRQIEYVLAIAEEKSISKAAERLNMSQPSLSQQLQRLEKSYGVTFFQRNSRNIHLTPAGEFFLKNGRRILELQKQTDRQLLEYSNSSRGSFSVGITPGRCATLVANVFPLFMEQFPQYNIRIIERSFSEINKLLLQNQLDIGFTAFIDNEPESKAPFRSRLLSHEEILLAISKKHPLAFLADDAPDGDIATADLAKFSGYNFALTPPPANIRAIAEQSFQAAGITPDIVYEVHDIKPIYQVIANSNLCTFIPEYYLSPSEERQLHFHLSPRRYWDFSISWAPTHFLSQAEQYFIDLCYEKQQERMGK